MPNLALDVFKKLPHFVLQSMTRNSSEMRLHGRLDPQWPHEHRFGTLYEIHGSSSALSSADFHLLEAGDCGVLQVLPYNDKIDFQLGRAYSCSRWRMHQITLIADQAIQWEDRLFHAWDAWSYVEHDGWRTTLPPDETPPSNAKNVKLIKAGWDHEHCALCNATIDEATFPRAFVGRNIEGREDWVCAACYDSRILSRSTR